MKPAKNRAGARQKGTENHPQNEQRYQEITDLSVSMLALMNMSHGVKSNRKYETQPGRIKKYTI